MPSRREFLKHAALGAGALAWSDLLTSIDKAAAIAPEVGSTFLDAEHVVVLMQENRSFDHCFGTLRGVRGFEDPRALRLPGAMPVWVQTNDAGESYVPFRLNLKDTSATWMGSLPHSWTDQVDARNGGRCDRWLQAKQSGNEEYARLPLTLGYYSREDIPFYYALADAFTVCDQHFCSSLTGTTPNRLYLWTGTVRSEASAAARANVLNSDVTYDSEASWRTFPEILQQHGVTWKVYQNELSIDTGLRGEADAWLANFTDNPLEWFTQYGVRYSKAHQARLRELHESLTDERAALINAQGAPPEAAVARTAELKEQLADIETTIKQWNEAAFERLSPQQRELHERAFSTNRGDAAYHELAELQYRDGDAVRHVATPKGDVLHQFRRDVESGQLPTVSWVVAPERFSDHPSSPWYGAWYLSEILEILTRRPEVWRKTVFILTYDENDGYFDHVPPFVPPHPARQQSGKTSAGIDASVEYVTLAQEQQTKPLEECRESPIGLGYRVPMVIASPWTRGGSVCSQVFDHTSVLQFMEVLLTHKLGREISESNISPWRRAVCGDLTSAFRPAADSEAVELPFHERDELVESIHRARRLPPPGDVRPLTDQQIATSPDDTGLKSALPRQEPGARASAPLPYELDVNAAIVDGTRLRIRFAAGAGRFGHKSAGAPFVVYASQDGGEVEIRNYAVSPGDRLEDDFTFDPDEGSYVALVHGPNGFFRQFSGHRYAPAIDVTFLEEWNSDGEETQASVRVHNRDTRSHSLLIADCSYGQPEVRVTLQAGRREDLSLDLSKSSGWYDVRVRIEGTETLDYQFAGRVESGRWGVSDPAIGRASG